MSRFDLSSRRLTVALLFALVAVLFGAPGQAAPTGPDAAASISLEGSSAVVAGCGVMRVEIWVRNVSGLNAADVRFTFDPMRLQVVDADPVSSGTQITPLSGFMKPDYVARKVACNLADQENPDCSVAGSVWYAATQTAPSAPVSGSGPIAAVDFIAVGSGDSPLTITYSKPVDIDGSVIPATQVSSQLTVQRPARPALSIVLSAPATAGLSWTSVVDAAQYRLFRDTAPYFTPVEPACHVTSALAYSDSGAVGDPLVNHFYVVKSGCSTGFTSDPSNRVGEFDFTLLPGEADPVVP